MVTQEIFHGHGLRDDVLSHRDALRPGEIVFGHFLAAARIFDLIVPTDEKDRFVIDHALDAAPIAMHTPFFLDSTAASPARL